MRRNDRVLSCALMMEQAFSPVAIMLHVQQALQNSLYVTQSNDPWLFAWPRFRILDYVPQRKRFPTWC
jgi:hypothetical protein